MAMNFDYDFSAWATKANTRCYDGLTIAPNAFKECDGKKVPVVWNHNHSGPEYVLGHALLQNRGKDGVYAYVKMNDTESGRTALEAVRCGDIDAVSIFANGLQKVGNTVKHGFIRELSLVLAGCNPGALIDEIVEHSAENEENGYEAMIYTDSGLSLTHGLDPDDNPLDEEDDTMANAGGKTLEEVVDTMNDEQKEALYALVGMAQEGLGDARLISGEDYGFTVEAYTYPDEWEACDGSASPVPGVTLGQQKRKAFGFSWQTKVGNDQNPDAGYVIHVVWNATAQPSERTHETVNDSPDAETFSWECGTVPVNVTGYKPVACMSFDSTVLGAKKMAKLEAKLYGDDSTGEPTLPTPDELIALVKAEA